MQMKVDRGGSRRDSFDVMSPDAVARIRVSCAEIVGVCCPKLKEFSVRGYPRRPLCAGTAVSGAVPPEKFGPVGHGVRTRIAGKRQLARFEPHGAQAGWRIP